VKIRLHAFEPASRANGPGLRAVVWFQGCTLGCPGCFNPATHEPQSGYLSDTETVAAQILTQAETIEGVSISGGEPLQQPSALRDLLCRLVPAGLSRLVFTGYTLAEVHKLPLGPRILPLVDVLIAGRYVASRHSANGLAGSTNQKIHLLTTRHAPDDFPKVPTREIILHRDGSMTITGINPWQPTPESSVYVGTRLCARPDSDLNRRD
jgi:anaerobic ribonucleoside-triphosphate reductase activating protein